MDEKWVAWLLNKINKVESCDMPVTKQNPQSGILWHKMSQSGEWVIVVKPFSLKQMRVGVKVDDILRFWPLLPIEFCISVLVLSVRKWRALNV